MDKILIIEDDVEINTLLTDFLKENGYVVYSQYDGLHVLDFLHKEKIDLIILDIMLPYRSGDIILADIRRQFTIPVLIISAKETTQNKIDLLRLGADDYITKPFGVMELISRVKALLRRTQSAAEETKICHGEIRMDNDKHAVFVGNEPCELTFKEYELLKYLMINAGIVLSRDKIMDQVWGFEYEGESRTVDMLSLIHISEPTRPY